LINCTLVFVKDNTVTTITQLAYAQQVVFKTFY